MEIDRERVKTRWLITTSPSEELLLAVADGIGYQKYTGRLNSGDRLVVFYFVRAVNKH